MDALVADCEIPDGWGWQQDVNAWSSLAFVGAAVVLAVAVWRGRFPRSVLVLAALSAVQGVGSMLFHGTPSGGAQLLHDVALLGMVGYIAGWHLGRVTGRSEAGAVEGAALALVAGVAIWAIDARATSAIAAVQLGLLVVSEMWSRRRGAAPVWTAPMLGLVGVGALMWLGGRTGSLLCQPDSALQLHAGWHVLAALLVVVWAGAAYRLTGPPRRLSTGIWC
ncbi:MAG: hypothetical protein H0V96_12195 [Acidimicrobiia bacterium]|nr:hypothetical protein [Acidimicrobiia bacterium]